MKKVREYIINLWTFPYIKVLRLHWLCPTVKHRPRNWPTLQNDFNKQSNHEFVNETINARWNWGDQRYCTDKFINKTKYDALYVPQNSSSTCPHVFVEVQNQTDKKFFVSAVEYSTLISERDDIIPTAIIVGVSTVTTSFMYMTEIDSVFSFARGIPCLGWAKLYLLSPSTLKLNKYCRMLALIFT